MTMTFELLIVEVDQLARYLFAEGIVYFNRYAYCPDTQTHITDRLLSTNN